MAEHEEPRGPSLEPPSLFRRRKRPEPAPEAPVDDSPATILDDTSGAEMTQPLAPSIPPNPSAPPPLLSDEVAAAPARSGPRVPERAAAALAGLLVGALIVGLTTASFELCSWIQGTNSCGGPGIFLLLAILVLAVVLGSVVLRLSQVPEPGSTSFLAVGLTSVVALLFLVDALFEWWMVIVIPLVSVATFLLSHWVTATFVEPAKPVGVIDDPEVVDHDVR
jgi:hypothetical protein